MEADIVIFLGIGLFQFKNRISRSKFQERVSKLENRLSEEQYSPKSCKNRRGISKKNSANKSEGSVFSTKTRAQSNLAPGPYRILGPGPNLI